LAKYPDFIGEILNIGNSLYLVQSDATQMKKITGSSQKLEVRLGER
jgi:hypothetical protein